MTRLGLSGRSSRPERQIRNDQRRLPSRAHIGCAVQSWLGLCRTVASHTAGQQVYLIDQGLATLTALLAEMAPAVVNVSVQTSLAVEVQPSHNDPIVGRIFLICTQCRNIQGNSSHETRISAYISAYPLTSKPGNVRILPHRNFVRKQRLTRPAHVLMGASPQSANAIKTTPAPLAWRLWHPCGGAA